MTMIPKLVMQLQCKLCRKALTNESNAADEDSLRENSIKARRSHSRLHDAYVICPLCSKFTHSKTAIQRIQRYRKKHETTV